jgi:hypothetical protein
MAVEANLSTPYDEAARAGLDAEQILEARSKFFVRAREIEERDGHEPGTLTRVGKPAPAPAAPAEVVDDDDGAPAAQEEPEDDEDPDA